MLSESNGVCLLLRKRSPRLACFPRSWPLALVLFLTCHLLHGEETRGPDLSANSKSIAPASLSDNHSSDPFKPSLDALSQNVGDDDQESAKKPASQADPSSTTSIVPPDAVAQSKNFNLKSAMLQSFEFTMFNHVWRAAFDPSLRYQIAHKPFVHDWFVSYKGYNLHRWNDGDDFIVNDVGHPLQGAVFARIFMQNEPRSWVPISKTRDYWVSRLKSTAWSAAWEVQWKVGPFSETSFGNAGGWEYVNGCGTALSCLHNSKYPSPPTNNTGLTDWIITPVVGLGWVLAEDTIERYIVAPVAENHRIFGGRILRSCLEPSKDFGAVFAGKFPWQLPNQENNFVMRTKPHVSKAEDPNQPPLEHWELGTQYTNISLPVLRAGCTGACREPLSGLGANFDYNLTRWLGFDSAVNFLPEQKGTEPMTEGLFGVKIGERWQHWGLFGKIRPGFIYYEQAMPGGGVDHPASLARFAADFGGIVELYPNRKSTLRFDVGTTLVPKSGAFAALKV